MSFTSVTKTSGIVKPASYYHVDIRNDEIRYAIETGFVFSFKRDTKVLGFRVFGHEFWYQKDVTVKIWDNNTKSPILLKRFIHPGGRQWIDCYFNSPHELRKDKEYTITVDMYGDCLSIAVNSTTFNQDIIVKSATYSVAKNVFPTKISNYIYGFPDLIFEDNDFIEDSEIVKLNVDSYSSFSKIQTYNENATFEIEVVGDYYRSKEYFDSVEIESLNMESNIQGILNSELILDLSLSHNEVKSLTIECEANLNISLDSRMYRLDPMLIIEDTKEDFDNGELFDVVANNNGYLVLNILRDDEVTTTLIEDFETINNVFNISGDWIKSEFMFNSIDPKYCFTSSIINDSLKKSSSCTFTINTKRGYSESKISFYYFIQRNIYGDFHELNMILNGEKVFSDSNPTNDWKYFEYNLQPGENVFELEHKQEFFHDYGVFIDQLAITNKSNRQYYTYGERIKTIDLSNFDIVKEIKVDWIGYTSLDTELKFELNFNDGEGWNEVSNGESIIFNGDKKIDSMIIKEKLLTYNDFFTPGLDKVEILISGLVEI